MELVALNLEAFFSTKVLSFLQKDKYLVFDTHWPPFFALPMLIRLILYEWKPVLSYNEWKLIDLYSWKMTFNWYFLMRENEGGWPDLGERQQPFERLLLPQPPPLRWKPESRVVSGQGHTPRDDVKRRQQRSKIKLHSTDERESLLRLQKVSSFRSD